MGGRISATYAPKENQDDPFILTQYDLIKPPSFLSTFIFRSEKRLRAQRRKEHEDEPLVSVGKVRKFKCGRKTRRWKL